jgi:hypothetical protein
VARHVAFDETTAMSSWRRSSCRHVASAGQPSYLGDQLEMVVFKVVLSLSTKIAIRRLTRADLGITFCRQHQVEHA